MKRVTRVTRLDVAETGAARSRFEADSNVERGGKIAREWSEIAVK